MKVDPLCNQPAGPRHSCHGRGHPPIPPRPLSQEPSRASVLLMLNPDVLVRKPTQAAETNSFSDSFVIEERRIC